MGSKETEGNMMCTQKNIANRSLGLSDTAKEKKATNSYDMFSSKEKRRVVYTISWNASLQAQEDHLRNGRMGERDVLSS
jgi:hypothetical protein